MNTFRWWFSQGCCCYCHQVASVVSRFVRSHRQQPTRLLCPWDFPSKSIGVGCHCLLQVSQGSSLHFRDSIESCPCSEQSLPTVCYSRANYWFIQAIAHRPDRSISSSLFLLPQSVRQKSSLSVCATKWERLVKCGSQGSLKEMCQAAGTRAGLLIWNSRFPLVRAGILRVQNSHSWIPATSPLQTQILHSLPGHLSLIFLKITLW